MCISYVQCMSVMQYVSKTVCQYVNMSVMQYVSSYVSKTVCQYVSMSVYYKVTYYKGTYNTMTLTDDRKIFSIQVIVRNLPLNNHREASRTRD